MIKYVKLVKRHIIVKLLLATIRITIMALVPYTFIVLFDNLNTINAFDLWKIIFIYAGCFITNAILNYFEELIIWQGDIIFLNAIKQDFFESLSNKSYSEFKEKEVGDYISIQTQNIPEIESGYLQARISVIESFITLFIYGIVLFLMIDWRIAIIILLVSIIILFVPNITANNLANKKEEFLSTHSNYVTIFQDLLEGFKLINSRTRKGFNTTHQKILTKKLNKQYEFAKSNIIAVTINGGSLYLLNIVAFSTMAILVFNKKLTIGTAMAALGYIESFISPIQNIADNFTLIKSLKKIENNIESLLQSITSKKRMISRYKSQIQMSNVNVEYDKIILKNFSHSFIKGKKYAIIGHNGAGKSTIINSIMNYCNISSGKITIDGININDVDTSEIIFCINQNEHVFSDTFNNNITVFNTYLLTSISDFITINNNKIILSLVDRNNCETLSGGEKQIICYLRMLASDCQIIMMDEPFSATDINTEKFLWNQMRELTDKTLIMTTHKISNELEYFDEILLMRDGVCVQHGEYSQIIKTKEYAELIKENEGEKVYGSK